MTDKTVRSFQENYFPNAACVYYESDLGDFYRSEFVFCKANENADDEEEK